MSKVIDLQEALTTVMKSGDKVDISALLSDEPTKCMVDRNIIKRKENLEFILLFLNQPMLLGIGKIGDCLKVKFAGRVGYYSFTYSYAKLDALYTNKENGIEATPIDEEDLKVIFEMTDFEFKGGTYIAKKGKDNDMYYIKYVNGREVFKWVLSDPKGNSYSAIFKYCPKIQFTNFQKIDVSIDSKNQNGVWKLLPSKRKISILNVFRTQKAQQ